MAGCAHVVVETEIELLESRMLNPRKIFTRCKLVTHLAGCRKAVSYTHLDVYKRQI